MANGIQGRRGGAERLSKLHGKHFLCTVCTEQLLPVMDDDYTLGYDRCNVKDLSKEIDKSVVRVKIGLGEKRSADKA
jgi:hypothetical protein